MQRSALLAGAALSAPALATEAYPTRPILVIIPVAPGGATDIIIRIVTPRMSEQLGQPIVIDSKPGAGGNIGAELVTRAQPDGYTLLAMQSSHAVNPSIFRNMSYDPFRDLVPIVQLSSQPYILTVPNSSPVHSLAELIALARSRPGGINYASAGAGLPGHLAMELLKSLAGFEAVHVPYRGGGPALMDTIAGRVDAYFPALVTAAPHVERKAVRVLAITSETRVPLLPETPTVAELGFPGFEVSGWYGLAAPAGTPPEIIDRIYTEAKRVLEHPEIIRRYHELAAIPVGRDPVAFRRYVRSEHEKWDPVIRRAGITSN
jgi:tripartite-type tricarboxylate transporter receptor subunit TctC